MLIICNGMPRSGSTMTYNLIRSYLQEIAQVHTLGFLAADDIMRKKDDLCAAAASSDLYIVKMHAEIAPSVIQPSGSVFEVYTIRDVRDIAASMARIWHHSVEKVKAGIEQHTAIARSYSARKDVSFIKYESINDQIEPLLIALSAAIDRSFSPDAMKTALQGSENLMQASQGDRFAATKSKVAWAVRKLNKKLHIGMLLKKVIPERIVVSLRNRVTFVDPVSMLHAGHVGGKVDPNSTAELTRMIQEDFSDWLSDFGYL